MKAATVKKLCSIVSAAAVVSVPVPCQAATSMLPWDFALLAMQRMLGDTIAPVAIGCAFAGSLFLYALGGHDEQAGRLFGSGVGGLIALAFVYFLNYVTF